MMSQLLGRLMQRSGQRLTGDGLGMFFYGLSRLLVVAAKRKRNTVVNIQPSLFTGILDMSHNLTHQALAFQFRRDNCTYRYATRCRYCFVRFFDYIHDYFLDVEFIFDYLYQILRYVCRKG